jgi:predicted RNA binding protein YcfA (HicA-like mRNA interferase family)
MPRGLKNWKYKDVINFLKKNGFEPDHQITGSHEFWVNKSKENIVNINKSKKPYPQRTLETMIRQSGIDKKEWRNN